MKIDFYTNPSLQKRKASSREKKEIRKIKFQHYEKIFFCLITFRIIFFSFTFFIYINTRLYSSKVFSFVFRYFYTHLLIYRHHHRFLTMADQDQAQSNNINQTESNASSTTKSTSKKSKNKAAAASSTTPKTDVPDGNSSTTTENNTVKEKFSLRKTFEHLFISIGSINRFCTEFIKTNRFS